MRTILSESENGFCMNCLKSCSNQKMPCLKKYIMVNKSHTNTWNKFCATKYSQGRGVGGNFQLLNSRCGHCLKAKGEWTGKFIHNSQFKQLQWPITNLKYYKVEQWLLKGTWRCFLGHKMTFRERLEYHQVCGWEGAWFGGSMVQSQALLGQRCRHLVSEGGKLRGVCHVDAARRGDCAQAMWWLL